MSKQDRQGVRTPSDLERKYNLGDMSVQTKQQSDKLSQLIRDFADMNEKIVALNEKLSAYYPVGSIYISLNETEPTTVFGGTWELMSQGYLLVGLDQGSEEALAEIQFLDNCYIWKRTA